MKRTMHRGAFLIGVMLLSGPTIASELYIYPAKGQSAEQLDKDKYECYSWAKNDTGFDPMAVPQATTAPPSNEKSSGGVVRGGVGGAVLGGIIGDSSKAAKRGAVAGGLIGGVRQSSQNSAAERERREWEQRESANYANNRNNYNRAYSACLEGRGYTVK
ncbi:hypothetical protein MIB92_04085 [Aestuariirhabdus sp. Z084]|uniref:hypothetical protein n=1 Tax=Aestuariirhabdus haliotis TaxID=2918751 RepID=UPI00201B3A90|nr:hypothetical protein [Aestuariirhabdus haliotis]MCL6414821.1 hypothetical protein [Aestuariirhabdus haliotis]MCL6418753.1 hypothetical protein [Aestuariirhabdus haliotis]